MCNILSTLTDISSDISISLDCHHDDFPIHMVFPIQLQMRKTDVELELVGLGVHMDLAQVEIAGSMDEEIFGGYFQSMVVSRDQLLDEEGLHLRNVDLGYA